MKLTNEEIFFASEPLKKLIEEKLPVKTSYQLAKLVNKLNEQLKVIDDVRQGLIKTYGEPDPDNKQQLKVNTEGENYQKFLADVGELFSQTVEVVFEKVKLPEQLDIEPSILMPLEKFVEV